MLIVAGLSLRSFKPYVWDKNSPYYLPDVKAVMISYADFHRMPNKRRAAMEQGIHAALGIPKNVKVYLDNGSFYFINREGETPRKDYEEFVEQAKPDWYPIPQDFIPTPKMSLKDQESCLHRTMDMNYDYEHDGFVPVIHISRVLDSYLYLIKQNEKISAKPMIALGGIVPNLLKAKRALSLGIVMENLIQVRQAFADKEIHVFGIGGTATLHVAALLGVDSVDSSGWRNRAARGIIQLPGTGDRIVAELGSWRGRRITAEEEKLLQTCECPACKQFGLDGLKANKVFGFRNRATHNLWILHNEARLIKEHIEGGSYAEWYKDHLDNTIYQPFIEKVLEMTRDQDIQPQQELYL